MLAHSHILQYVGISYETSCKPITVAGIPIYEEHTCKKLRDVPSLFKSTGIAYLHTSIFQIIKTIGTRLDLNPTPRRYSKILCDKIRYVCNCILYVPSVQA